MIDKRVAELLNINIEKHILIFDWEHFDAVFDYRQQLIDAGYAIFEYNDIEEFRLKFETLIKNADTKNAVIVETSTIYIPYDIQKFFTCYTLSLINLYPNLNAWVLKQYMQDLNLVDYSYDRNYKLLVDESQTKDYICNEVFSKDNIHDFILDADILLLNTAKRAKHYLVWIKIAKENAKIEYYAAIIGYQRKTEELNGSFKQFLLSQYKTISGSVNKYAPSILTKTIDFIAHDRVVLIVMDGMSLFDFGVISRH